MVISVLQSSKTSCNPCVAAQLLMLLIQYVEALWSIQEMELSFFDVEQRMPSGLQVGACIPCRTEREQRSEPERKAA